LVFIENPSLNKINMESLNVFGKKIELCSTNPMTGFYRNGCCETGPNDYGTHTVCAIVDDEFLRFSKERGNDLTTENPQYNFKGLKNGDKWCLCVSRWIEAYKSGCAPKIILESTNIKTLEYITFEELLDYKF
tara:strand:- start:859 stop:1257 length:399 start_codon:yes stop_codon:yes gene_type:complete